MRVFLSSTFVDMQDERDYLVKKIFPSIKAECRRRGVDFVALDLRWGITEEEARSGKVVEICMDEIVRSRPFFIGLIGGMYGTVPKKGDDSITEKLLTKYPWIDDCVHSGLSITEMEMQFGVLNNPDHVYAYFFHREESSIARKYRETKGSEKEQKLLHLKESVKKAADEGKCSLSSYSSVEALGKEVHAALMARIDELYPLGDNSLYATYSRRQHEFLDSRRSVYVCMGNQHVPAGNTMVVGSSGAGKSAFVANSYHDEGDGTYLIHTVVNSDISTAEKCRRMLLYELAQQVPGFDLSVLQRPEDQHVDLETEFSRAGFEGKVRWVIDGVEKLLLPEDRACTWVTKLPSQISELIVTVTDISVISSLLHDRFEKVFLKPLVPGEIWQITVAYLKTFAKALSKEQASHISNSSLLTNPESLMVFLEELLQFGVHEKLGEFVEGYLSSKDTEEFYLRVLQRLESDFGFDKVKTLFACVVMCENGAPIDELIKRLKVNNIDWVAIYSAILPFVSESMGYLSIDDSNMENAARLRYDIASMEKDRSVVMSLVRMLERENRRKMKDADSRLYEKEGAVSYIMFKSLMKLFSVLKLLHAEFTPEEQDRVCKNALSIISLYTNAGMLRKAMSKLRSGNLYVAMQKGINGFSKVMKILSDPRNHLSDLVDFRIALASRLDWGFHLLTVYTLFINSFTEPQRKESEKRLLLKKIERLPFNAKEKAVAFSILNEEDDKSLESLLELQDISAVFPEMTLKIFDVFLLRSQKRIRHIRDLAIAAIASTDDETVKGILYFIAAACCLRCGDPDADEYLAASVSDANNPENVTAIYDMYDLFSAVLKKDHSAYERLKGKVVEYKDNEFLGIREIYYRVMLAQSYFEDVDQETYDRLMAEYISSVSDSPWGAEASLKNSGYIFENMKLYRQAYTCNLALVSLMDESKYDEKVTMLRDAVDSAVEAHDYDVAESACEQVWNILVNNPQAVEKSPLWKTCEDFENLYRLSRKYDLALEWGRKCVDELKRSGECGRLPGAYNCLGLDAAGAMSMRVCPPQKMKDYFDEAYNAYVQSEMLYDGVPMMVVANRARLVFEEKEYIGENAAEVVDEHIRRLEGFAEVQGLDSEKLRYILESLVKGYIATERWGGLYHLKERYGLIGDFIYRYCYSMMCHSGISRAEVLSKMTEDFISRVMSGKVTLPSIYSEIESLGFRGDITALLVEQASDMDLDAGFKASLALAVLAEMSSDEPLKQEYLEKICGIFLKERKMLRYYECVSCHFSLSQMLDERGVSPEDIEVILLEAKLENLSNGKYLDVEPVIWTALKPSSDPKCLKDILLQVSETDGYDYSDECFYALEQKLEQLSLKLESCDSRLKEEILALLDFIAIRFREQMTSIDEELVDRTLEFRRKLNLPCDPGLVWFKMYLLYDFPSDVLKMWEDNPDCHSNLMCQRYYIQALRYLASYEEAEKFAWSVIEDIENPGDRMPIVSQLILILRNTGRYVQALELLERYKDVAGDWVARYTEELLLAYSGRPSDALYMLEEHWIDENYVKYYKSIFLLRQGLAKDAQKIISEVDRSEDQPGDEWLYALYLIECARHCKAEGDIEKARTYMSEARELMSVLHMGMCEYEASQLGLD